MGMNPTNAHEFRPVLERGAARAGRSLDTLEISSGCGVRITDDVAGTLAKMKPQTAFFIGGYGTREHNFHRDAMVRRGYRSEAERIQELFLAGRRDEAAAAVPDEYLDDGGLIGSPQRIKERLQPWLSCGITSLTVNSEQDEALELMADLVGAERLKRLG
jgi:alkanesulfonate monooxygenase SsuD/methylene tetrahydromethanopterin reductase-like flavin-dependent oxidoreductase (luciferase family)